MSSLAFAAGVAFCAGTGGVGCVVFVSVVLGASYGIAAQVGTAVALKQKPTAGNIFGWMGSSAVSPAINGYSVARYGAKPAMLGFRWLRSRF